MLTMADALERLNERQRRFVLEYSKSGNGTQAATYAGYSPKTARQIASRLLRNVNVREALSNLSKLDIVGTTSKATPDPLTLTNVDIAVGHEKLNSAETRTDHPHRDAPTKHVPSLHEVEEWRRARLAEIDAAIIGVQARKDELRRRSGLLVYQVGDLRPAISDKLQAQFDALETEYWRLRRERSRVEVEAIIVEVQDGRDVNSWRR